MSISTTCPVVPLEKLNEFSAGPDTRLVIQAVKDADASVGKTIRLCLIAGQYLVEKKAALGHGRFEAFRKCAFPYKSEGQLRCWQRAAINLHTKLPPPAIDIEVSVILAGDENELPPEALVYRQQYFDFVSGKTLGECSAKEFLEGSDGALNGALHGGNPSGKSRSGYDKFIGRDLARITHHLRGHGRASNYTSLNREQQRAVEIAFETEIQHWPPWVLKVIREKTLKELRMEEFERTPRYKNSPLYES